MSDSHRSIYDVSQRHYDVPVSENREQVVTTNLPLRDAFAIGVLAAIYANAMKEADEGSELFSHPDWRYGIALDAYRMADAMLKARGDT